MPRLAHQDPSEGKDLHEALRDVSPAEAEEFKKNVLSPAEIERRKNRKANPTPSRPEVLMSDTALRASLIRLAFQNPSLRADILPLVSKEAGSYQEYVDRKRSKGEKPLTENAWRSRTQGGGKGEKKDEGKGEAGQPAEKKPAKSFKKNYRPKMESVMKKHELTDDDAAQVIQFSIDRPKKGKPQSPAELMRRFMQNAKPETKARMKNMSPAEFMIMLRAVLDQEEGGGKAASLRTAAIRFAHENPALRKHVLAALKEADEGSPEADKSALAEDADPKSHDQNLASTWEKVDGKQAMDKTAAGPDSTGRNWKKHKVGGTTHWIWQGRPGEPIKQFMVIQKKAGAFDNSYWMTVKLEDGSFFQSPIQKVKPTDWFKRAAEIYAASQVAPPDLTTQPEMWKKIAAGDKTAADFRPEGGEVEDVRDDLIAALKKKGIQAKDATSRNVLYIGDVKYAIHGPWLEGEGLGDRGKWIQKPTRAAWLAEAVKVLSGIVKEASIGKTAFGPDPMGRNWKEKDTGGKHRWVWAGQGGDPAFTVTEYTAPVGTYYKLSVLLPDGTAFQTFGQKTEKEHWFMRAAKLFKAFQSAAGFDLSAQPEKWSRL